MSEFNDLREIIRILLEDLGKLKTKGARGGPISSYYQSSTREMLGDKNIYDEEYEEDIEEKERPVQVSNAFKSSN